jgi:hypothetical protein
VNQDELIEELRHSLAFTGGRGTEVQDTAVRSYAPLVVGLAVENALQDPGAFSRRLGGDNTMRSSGWAQA